MSSYKFASLAGMAAAVVTTAVQYTVPAMAQPETPGRPGSQPTSPTPPRQPGSPTTPGQPTTPGTPTTPTTPGQPTTPGSPTTQPGMPRTTQPGMTGRTGQRIFALESPTAETRLNELAQRLQRLESQMEESNQRILRQLGQARTLEGDRKVDALADVIQTMVQDHTTLNQYLTDIRTSLTGEVSRGLDRDPNMMPRTPSIPPRTTPGSPTTPGTTPGGSPTTPGGTPGGSPTTPR